MIDAARRRGNFEWPARACIPLAAAFSDRRKNAPCADARPTDAALIEYENAADPSGRNLISRPLLRCPSKPGLEAARRFAIPR